MSSIAKAFAPGNISCIFVIKKNKNPAKSGSLGMGFTIDKGVIVSIKKLDNNVNKKISENNNIIYFNNKKINFATVNFVVEKLTDEKIIVKIKSELPLGCGFGLSGASALATAYALNKLLKLKKSKKELAFLVHVAEVENMTGLGDAVNQYYGGFLVKFQSSHMFKVKKLAIKNKTIYYKYFSAIDTKKTISNKKIKNKINDAGIKSLNKIKKITIIKTHKNQDFWCPENSKNFHEINRKNIFKEIIKISKEFSIKSNLLQNKRIIDLIKNIEKSNGNASMIMLGNAVFSDKYFKGSKKLVIKDRGAYIL
ncbi:hypothetical protein CMO93_00495 [Candidatus Woesearchaeota archaeon]|nr:hypothetical protein [Candidatus Woesearchaeota archaeon]|tara:strand:- start:1196 stop:2125 length:930 start_codon:yes stop_codon:yes gene_type:complete